MSLQAPDVRRGFKKLTPISGRPNYTTLKLAFKQTHFNAQSIPSSNGDGKKGHLRCCYTLAEFNVLVPTNKKWADVPAPTVLAEFTTGADPAETNRVTTNWTMQMTVYERQTAADLALTTDPTEAIKEDYYEELNHTVTGYSEVKCVDLLKHLKDNYGALRDKDITAYNEKIKEPWDESQSLESVFNRIKRCQTALANTTPVCDRAAVLCWSSRSPIRDSIIGD